MIWGGGSGLTVIYGDAAPVNPPRIGFVKPDHVRNSPRASSPVARPKATGEQENET